MSHSNTLQVPGGRVVRLHKAVTRFLEDLNSASKAKSTVTLETLSAVGLSREFRQLRHVQGNLWELRVDTDKPNRLFLRYMFVMCNGDFLVTHVYNKQTNTAPRQEIELALDRAKE